MTKTTIKLFTLALVAGTLALTSCGKKTAETSDGIKYTYIEEGDQAPKDGEFVIYNFSMRNDEDSTIVDSYVDRTPQYYQFVDSLMAQEVGVGEIIRVLKNGDSIVVNLTAAQLYSNGMGIPPFMQEDDQLQISIGVLAVLKDQTELSDWMRKFNEESARIEEENSKVTFQKDVKTIDAFLAEKGLEPTVITESGVRVVIEQAGTGENAQAGQEVSVNYFGTLLDGAVFDTNDAEKAKENNVFMEGRNYEPFTFQLGAGMVIKGWDEGLAALNKGAKAKLYIPSTLAYGSRARSEVIKANSILVFDVELLEIK